MQEQGLLLFRQRRRRLALLGAAVSAGLLLWAASPTEAAVPPDAPSVSLLQAIVDQVLRLFLNM